METITLNNYQRTIMDDMTDFYRFREHELTVENVSLYLESLHDEIDIRDEMQIYNYLYGVQENIRYNANDENTRRRAETLMEEFDTEVERLDELLEDSDDETETLDNENDHHWNYGLYNYTVSPIETDEYGVGLPIPILEPPMMAPPLIREWTASTIEADETSNLDNYMAM